MTLLQRKDLILVVDDSPESLGMVHHALDQAGMNALLALDGQQAIEIAEKMTPDLILLDALMPELNGFDTCRLLKQQPALATIPVIFMTGLTDAEDVVHGLEAGGVDYVTKPIRTDELVARIRVHLANARMTQSAHSALDKLGQSVFATNLSGHWLWSTPQVSQYLEAVGPPQEMRSAATQQIQNWLSRSPEPGSQLSLHLATGEFRLRYLGTTEHQEYLFRLLNNDGEGESQLLQVQLRLTTRESQVLLWIAQGKTNREIGQILDLSPRTVNKHLEQIFRKLGVENRTSAAAMAFHCLTRI
ncbi:response regulator transcription factor [Halomonas sp. KM007]|uniref:response regulator n=1 Tax=Halomonas sp. BC1 TaxID=1670448 RepID=UPI0009BCD03C|nr:response regulator transcription factor [Halomonas sp. BC1]